MKVKKNKNPSIIARFREKFAEQKIQMIFSAIVCAFVLSFSIIGTLRFNVSGNSLLANVSSLNNNQTITAYFEADIALQDTDNEIRLIAGKDMEKVSIIEGIIALNPEKGGIFTENSNIIKESEGVYRFYITLNEKTIKKGSIIAHFQKNEQLSTPMSLLNTQFVSGENRYNLTNTILE